MSKHVNWSGVFPAVTTQFNADFSVNLEETHTVISNLVRDGVSGLVVCGSVGENTSLTIEEKMAVTEVAKDASGGRVPVICGIAEFTSAGAAKRMKRSPTWLRTSMKRRVSPELSLKQTMFSQSARETRMSGVTSFR